MVFENTGEAIGVTMPHPHGQIYAFPFHPPLVEEEFRAAAEYLAAHSKCLHCELLHVELANGARIVASNENFVAFVPFAARFPSEIHIYSRRHFGAVFELQGQEADDLASMISIIRQKYDNMYGFLGRPEGPLPLMMVLRQAPAKGDNAWFHFHNIEFLPIQRSPKKLKYLASVESAGGTFLADTRPEERAAELRKTKPATD
jgi:UDPglucose--hexose-1-phosphate uridylyltransferase